jgi:hypothetical protein
VVKFSPTITVVGDGVLSPRVASFSSRGPSPSFPGILKVYRQQHVQDDIQIVENLIFLNNILTTS